MENIHEKLKKITKIIVDTSHPSKVILFGSHTKGNTNIDSDYDILIIKESNLPRPKRSLAIRKRLRGLKTPIDILVYTQKEIDKYKDIKTSFIYDVISTGKVLYES